MNRSRKLFNGFEKRRKGDLTTMQKYAYEEKFVNRGSFKLSEEKKIPNFSETETKVLVAWAQLSLLTGVVESRHEAQ